MTITQLPTRAEVLAAYERGPEAVVAMVEQLCDIIRAFNERVKRLEDILAKDSHNSHKPPASDSYSPSGRRTIRSLRRPSGKKPGGQPGHGGATLRQTDTPQRIENVPSSGRCFCGRQISEQSPKYTEKRQVFDIPSISVEVTEYRGTIRQCECGRIHLPNFPKGVHAPVQYGPNLSAMATYLTSYQLLPFERTAQLFSDMFGTPLSRATLVGIAENAYQFLAATDSYIKQQVQTADVVNFDETGLYVVDVRAWLHSAGTEQFTLYHWDEGRGREAMERAGILPHFTGTAVHDEWSSYFSFEGCRHALCNAHLLRELTFLAEQRHQPWAASMKRFLRHVKHLVKRSREAGHRRLHPRALRRIRKRYRTIVSQGLRINPATARTQDDGKRGKVAQDPSRNMLLRLHKHIDSVLAFAYDFDVPFDNNLAERDIRMVKVQQKISGRFRTEKGANVFCRIRGYISTVRKQGRDLINALQSIFTVAEPTANLLLGT